MATTTMNQYIHPNDSSFGLGRMSEDEYEREFKSEGEEGGAATPRPGTSKTENAAAARAASRAIWSFSARAAATATANKRRTTARTDYRVAANITIKKALNDKEQRLCRQRITPTPGAASAVMSEADFDILRQAIERFSVRIVVHDSITLEQLKQMQLKCQADLDIHTAMMTLPVSGEPSDAAFIRKCQEEYKSDLTQFNESLSTEIIRMCCAKETVPSQHAQIEYADGMTLQNILSPETIRRRFLSLNALARAIRSDLLAFLANDFRSKDHAIVVQQIKNSHRAAKKEH